MALNERITDWRGRRVWLVGASSGIGAALAGRLSAQGARLALSARSADKLADLASGLSGAVSVPLDVTSPGALASGREAVLEALGGIDLAIFNAGTYRPLRSWELDAAVARETVAVNLLGVMDGLAVVLPSMVGAGRGGVAIVGSVAGYGGLPKAVTYGPSKAALINLAEVLYLDLAPRGLSVWLIDPGFVDTPLTAGNDFEMPALISADEAAAQIMKGFASGGFEIHFPKRFTRVMKLLRLLPHRLYFPLIRKVTGL
ncbi:MAG: SDR family NAD(P)-dependent oxidoreductase [Zoogloeaceae bacterium]|nr:SDR family NAD(P)-dependent oxidoreductase [Rhodocyclaceae bacterium]MCP5231778.1 SDR family NAD(P)-dependent oxidoreductase [Zoogloeaceae bacterium]MCP5241000.1 SDR family NAD(P)-dependent oxidoreductase [Zoogloeaceae bacterium]MCP5255625.1 SDR family NAD(P)-dependent oxidoreductase [Zoogloeaceae bacterium]MCP5294682.1 SDR family NAD(P)-dependent oxidoreductase [Zoogloeaceae bacterium]